MIKICPPAPELEPEVQVTLRAEYCALSHEHRLQLVNVARLRAAEGKCFLCKRIVEQTHHDEFPHNARVSHLMLCCLPRFFEQLAEAA